MSSARRAAWLPMAVVVGGLFVATSPAHAATATWKTPTDNATYTGGSIEFVVGLSRSLTEGGSQVQMNLAIPGPQPGPYKVASTTGSELRFTFSTTCPNHAGACAAGSAPAYNGRYTASLSGAATGSRTVVLQAPPAAPTGVAATATGQHRVKVTWAANREPDLTGYDVFTSDGTVVAESLPTTTAEYEFDLPSSGYGGEHGYVVRAHRLACANCSGPEAGATLPSAMSQPGTVTLDEPTPEPEPTDQPDDSTGGTANGSTDGGTANGSTGGSANGSGNGGNGSGGNAGNGTSSGGNGGFTSGPGPTTNPAVAQQQQRLAFGVTFKNFAPKLGAPKLPPLPKFSEAPIPEGTYDPLLEYGPQEAEDPTMVAEGGGSITSIVDTFTNVFEAGRFFRSIAIALLLLLAAGHVRMWLRHEPTH